MLAQALTAYEALICSDCGQPMHESLDPENEGKYVAPLPVRCHACTAVEQRAASYADNDFPRALKFTSELHASARRPGAG